MPAPPARTLARELYDGPLWPYVLEDAASGYDFANFLTALLADAQPIADLVRDDPNTGAVGWSALVDVDRAPAWALPWLAALVGVVDNPGLSDAARRLRIREMPGQRRGTVGAMMGAARQHLIGPLGTGASATVYMSERAGSAYRLNVSTFVSETPNPDLVEEALMEAKPAGIVLNYQTIGAGTWADVLATHADWQEVLDDFDDWEHVLTDPTHT